MSIIFEVIMSDSVPKKTIVSAPFENGDLTNAVALAAILQSSNTVVAFTASHCLRAAIGDPASNPSCKYRPSGFTAYDLLDKVGKRKWLNDYVGSQQWVDNRALILSTIKKQKKVKINEIAGLNKSYRVNMVRRAELARNKGNEPYTQEDHSEMLALENQAVAIGDDIDKRKADLAKLILLGGHFEKL
jgi:hypothetical protein